MKKVTSILMLLLLFATNSIINAEIPIRSGNIFYIYRNDGDCNAFFNYEVLNMRCSRIDLNGTEQQNFVVQEIQTRDSIYRIPLAAIDSIQFVPLGESVNNLPVMMKKFCGVYESTSVQSDFGWPASMLLMDVRTADISSTTSGYNWFSGGQDYSDKNAESRSTSFMWYTNYNMIEDCNSILVQIDPETKNKALQTCMAQALGFRAWAYFNLAQMYQFTYIGNQDKPCVPIITEENMTQVDTEGVPRATVQDVYAQILSDLNKAIELLNGLNIIRPEDRFDKQFITVSTAKGIRARVNLVMNNWEEAAADAKYVIDNSGCTPYSIADVSRPSFWDASDTSWLFAIDIESGEVGNLHCWPGHFVTFYTGGYAQVGVFRMVNKALFESIPATDVRKGWWCDANGESPNLDSAHSDILYNSYSYRDKKEFAYVNVKFDTYNSEFSGMCYLNDIPLMRIEEMYYTYAEATAMAGGDGAAILNDFVKTYRDPSYNFTGSGQAVQDECWHQRRIELWGEGLAYYDIQRLKKSMNRVGGGFEPTVCFDIPADSPLRIYLIPQSAMDKNQAIGKNNEEGPDPSPIAE